LSSAKDSRGLAGALALRKEQFVRVGGVEGEHLVVAGDDPARADVVCELRGFAAVEIAGDAAFGAVAVDGEEGHVDRESAQLFHQARIQPRIPAVIERPRAAANDVAEEFVVPGGVAFEFVVRGGDAVKGPAGDFRARTVVEADGSETLICSRSATKARLASGITSRIPGFAARSGSSVSASR
jgi:hypothetical protein